MYFMGKRVGNKMMCSGKENRRKASWFNEDYKHRKNIIK
jgi:hypothetical protein